MKRTHISAAIAACTAVAVIASYAAAQSSQADGWFSTASNVRHALYREAGLPEPISPSYLILTVVGGLPPGDRFTVHLAPSADGALQGELLIQDQNRSLEEKVPRRVLFHVSANASANVTSILAGPNIWGEPTRLAGQCTDQPITVLEIRWGSRSRRAARLACARDGTASLIELILKEVRGR